MRILRTIVFAAPRGHEPVAHGVELFERLLVVVVTADVKPGLAPLLAEVGARRGRDVHR